MIVLAINHLGGGFIFFFHPYLGKIPILTNIFQMGWNHQLDHVSENLNTESGSNPKLPKKRKTCWALRLVIGELYYGPTDLFHKD